MYMKFSFKSLLMVGLSTSLAVSLFANKADAQEKSRDQPLGQRYYTQKVQAILADDVITIKEIAELTYLFKQNQVQTPPVLKKLSKSEAKRALDEETPRVVDYGGASVNLSKLNEGVKDKGLNSKYVRLVKGYRTTNDGKSNKDYQDAVYEINAASLDYLVTEAHKGFDKRGLSKDSTDLRVILDNNPSTSGIRTNSELKEKYVLEFSTSDLTILSPDENLAEAGHEDEHLFNLDSVNPDNSLERKKGSENGADHRSRILNNYDLESEALLYYDFQKYDVSTDFVVNGLEKAASKNKLDEFVNAYSGELSYSHKSHAPNDPHASTFERLKQAVLDFAGALKKEAEPNTPLVSAKSKL